MNKRFIRTTFDKFESVNKEQYRDCIVFIEDTKEIWTNDIYYARNDNEDSNILYDLETGLDLNGDQVKTINKLIIDQNGLVYSNNELVINNIKVNNTIIEKDDSGAVEIPIGDLNVQSDWNEKDETSDTYIKNKPSIPSEVTENTVSDWGFTKNTGTVTEIKMNNTSKGTSGIVDLGTVVTDAVVSQTATDVSITDGVLTIPALMGKDGEKGDDGISATHFWDGTTLTITSASGTSSADLKGDKGEKGDVGTQGEQGPQGIQGEQGVPGYTPIKGVDYTDGLNGAFVTEYSDGVLNTTSDLENQYYNTEFISMTNNDVTIEPNKYYCWSEPLEQLKIQLSEPLNTDILNIYTIEFTTSESGCTLILPETIKWCYGNIPSIQPSLTYVMSISNNLVIIQNFDYAK